MKIFNRFSNQSGRSLVEMLAVLVIIGILSVTALYGFSYALETNRENETLDRFSKVVAGARTSRILESLGDLTKYDTQTGALLPEFRPQVVNMRDIISNIGDDIIVEGNKSFIFGPLKGPIKDGTEEKVKIYVYVETPSAFTVYADNLTYNACMKIVSKDLGNDFIYEAKDAAEEWLASSSTKDNGMAKDFCSKIAPQTTPGVQKGTLVMWFGPYECMDEGCVPPACKGAECCCETVGTKTTLKNPAPTGCMKPAGGGCVDCAETNASGMCVPKAGLTECNPSCSSSMCTSTTNPFYCGNNLCCANASDCGDGKCKGGTTDSVTCKEPRPTACGMQCCSEDEECINKKCQPKETEHSCVSTQVPCYDYRDGHFTVCCSVAFERCNAFGQCIPLFPNSGSCPSERPIPCPDSSNCCAINQQCDKGVCRKTNYCPECPLGGVEMDNGKCCCSPGWVVDSND